VGLENKIPLIFSACVTDRPLPSFRLAAAEKGFRKPAVSAAQPSPAQTVTHLPSVRLPALEIQETWYPSVRKTLWLLSELHSFIAVRLLSLS
jgi:hypothetical protein